jgi:dolichol-phosphate mannosyltransferase
MRIVIILPTYNERENLRALIPAIEEQFAAVAQEMSILVVDDDSPDGTANIAIELASQWNNIHLIAGPKRGLGVAYVRGILYALSELKAEAVIEMDADFSHKPEDLPRLIEGLKSHDVVIGSRYVPGGSISASWSLWHRAVSFGGNVFARHVAGIRNVRDRTAGFRAIRASMLEGIDVSSIEGKGYSFQIGLLHRLQLGGARVLEIPVEFVDRSWGTSKLGVKDILEFIFLAWSIRLASLTTFVKFALVGLLGVGVNLGVLTALLAIGTNKFIASPIAIETSILTNFLLNNRWTFAERSYRDGLPSRGLKFNVVSVVALALSYSTFVLLSLAFPLLSALVAQALAVIPATLINYFFNSYWTFRSQPVRELPAAAPRPARLPPPPEAPQKEKVNA